VSGFDVPSLGCPSRTSSAGIASAPSATTTTLVASSGRRITIATQRAPMVRSDASLEKVLPRSMRGPAKASSAGTSVRLSATAMAIAVAAAIPICARNGTPVTTSATSAMITVEPANTTALPAVPVALAAASRGSRPSPMFWRWRDRMNSA